VIVAERVDEAATALCRQSLAAEAVATVDVFSFGSERARLDGRAAQG
jgi:hypothetical protein